MATEADSIFFIIKIEKTITPRVTGWTLIHSFVFPHGTLFLYQMLTNLTLERHRNDFTGYRIVTCPHPR
jgi:hypothetical protein